MALILARARLLRAFSRDLLQPLLGQNSRRSKNPHDKQAPSSLSGARDASSHNDATYLRPCSSLTAAMTKVAAILGAGPGNGAAFARKFLAEGYKVAVCSRSADAMTTLATSLSSPDQVRGYPCDVTSDEAVQAAFSSIQKDLGPVSTVIYNAGSGGFKPTSEWTPAEVTQAADINAAGLFRAANAALPQMESLGGGTIVVVGAGAATRGRPMTVGFAAGKAAQRSVAQSLARAWWPKKIHVCYMIIDGLIYGENAKSVVPDKPDDFFLHSEDIAEAIWNVANQNPSAWTFEFDVRPFGEQW